jgi:hypothetical protein
VADDIFCFAKDVSPQSDDRGFLRSPSPWVAHPCCPPHAGVGCISVSRALVFCLWTGALGRLETLRTVVIRIQPLYRPPSCLVRVSSKACRDWAAAFAGREG